MRQKAAVAAVALVVLMAASGCRSLANIENPDYVIRGVQPRVAVAIPFSASTLDLNFDIEVRNPNAVALRLDRIDFDVLINGSRVISSVSSQNIRIPANGSGNVRLRGQAGYREIQSLFREVADLIQGGRANYEVRGDVYYNTPLGQLKFPLTVFSSGDRSPTRF